MTTGPRDPAGAGRDRIRAGHVDREQVVRALKAAFVAGRLTKDEFAARMGQALAARTYGDLAALTADLPAEPAAAEPALAAPAPELRRPMATSAAVACVCLVIAVAALLVAGHLASGGPYDPSPNGIVIGELLSLVVISAATGLSALAVGAVVSIERRRARRRLPPRAPGDARAVPGAA